MLANEILYFFAEKSLKKRQVFRFFVFFLALCDISSWRHTAEQKCFYKPLTASALDRRLLGAKFRVGGDMIAVTEN